jgi:hypothetical protein
MENANALWEKAAGNSKRSVGKPQAARTDEGRPEPGVEREGALLPHDLAHRCHRA